jgi:uncharacterized membrane protein
MCNDLSSKLTKPFFKNYFLTLLENLVWFLKVRMWYPQAIISLTFKLLFTYSFTTYIVEKNSLSHYAKPQRITNLLSLMIGTSN